MFRIKIRKNKRWFVDTLIKWLNMKWVWFQFSYDKMSGFQSFGIQVWDKYIITYYKGSVSGFHVDEMDVIIPSVGWDNYRTGIRFTEFISREKPTEEEVANSVMLKRGKLLKRLSES